MFVKLLKNHLKMLGSTKAFNEPSRWELMIGVVDAYLKQIPQGNGIFDISVNHQDIKYTLTSAKWSDYCFLTFDTDDAAGHCIHFSKQATMVIQTPENINRLELLQSWPHFTQDPRITRYAPNHSQNVLRNIDFHALANAFHDKIALLNESDHSNLIGRLAKNNKP